MYWMLGSGDKSWSEMTDVLSTATEKKQGVDKEYFRMGAYM
jgi:hypothetical protein